MKFPETPHQNKEDIWYRVGLVIGALLFVPGMLFLAAIVKAYVLSTLWHWYIVKFFSQPELPLAISFGIGLIVTYISGHRDNYKDMGLAEKLAYIIVLPAFTLLAGWLGTFFI